MFKNYLKISIRNLWKNKTYSFLNIFGLAIGITCAGLIFLWVEDEKSYDSMYEKKDRLYFIRENQQYDGSVRTFWSTPGPLGPAIKAEIPGIANTCRRSEGSQNKLFSIAERSMYAGGCYAEPSLFTMFTLPFEQGNPQHAFDQLYSLVITEKTAKKFFGDSKSCIGKTVRMDNKHDYVVTGVIKDFPSNSTLQFEWVAPFEIYWKESDWVHKWGNNSLATYVELGPGVSVASVNGKLFNYLQTRQSDLLAHTFLFSMNDWRLYDEFENGKQTGGGRIEYVRLFSVIAWIILIIACINFMNLATARSERRAREVGVRKVLGAQKKWLVSQFISEALLMSLLAAVIAIIMISIVLPAFNLLVQKDLAMNLGKPMHLGALLGITIIAGLLSGSYPSLYLSSFNPVFVLKGVKLKSGSAALIRKGLVVLQFSVSIILIIGTIIIFQQIQHVRRRALGFNKDNLIEMRLQGSMEKNFQVIKHDLVNTGTVQNAALSDHTTIDDGNNTYGMTWKGKTQGKVLISTRYITPEFISTSGMKIIDGRDFSTNDSAGGINVLVTESLAKLMGKESAIGKQLHYEGDTTSATIVGVVADYVYGDMYGKPDPDIFLCLRPGWYASVMYVRLNDKTNTEQALGRIEKVMKADNPAYPFQFRFVDDQFNDYFTNETLISKLSRLFAMLAIIISCLGLFGLAAYTAERRTKEIGIRKVLGASVTGITRLLSSDFLRLVFIAALVAFPVSWWAMNSWLQNYAYHITISWWVFVAAGALAIFIALATISFQAVKAALMNPVKSLRTE